MLVPNIEEYNILYCGNEDCPRYGLYTGLIETEESRKKQKQHQDHLDERK